MKGPLKKGVKLVTFVTLKPAIAALLKIYFAILGRKSWMPIFYFFLPGLNPASVQILHTLHKIQVATGRRLFLVSAWPFWPPSTGKDPSFTSFIKNLTPNIRLIWIPKWLQRAAWDFMNLLARSIGRHEDLYLAASLDSPVRYSSSSTLLNREILIEGNRNVLQIPKSHEDILESQLREMGVPADTWFVCVHAREHGWYTQLKPYGIITHPRHLEMEAHRNVDIDDYLPAIDFIRSQGGMVVRMGDTSMKPMGDIDGVIDYPFTKYKSMTMDLYIVSKCRFVVGCNSGFSTGFPVAFNTPVLFTNFPCPANTARLPYSNNIFLFQPGFEIASGEKLPLEKMFHPSLSTVNDGVEFAGLGYRFGSNSPEEVLEATQEMLTLVENDAFSLPRSKEQELFHQYRLQSLDAVWSPAQQTGNTGYSKIRTSESRISAVFAARHFNGDRSQPSDIEL